MIHNQGFVSKLVIINHLFMDQKLHAAISISYKLNSSEHAKIKFHWKHFLVRRIQKHFAVITPFVLLRKLLVWREIANLIILLILSDILNFELSITYKIQVIKQGFIDVLCTLGVRFIKRNSIKKVDQNRCNSSSLGHRLHKKFMHVAMLFNRREVFVDK